jgi:hypothetical protein
VRFGVHIRASRVGTPMYARRDPAAKNLDTACTIAATGFGTPTAHDGLSGG